MRPSLPSGVGALRQPPFARARSRGSAANDELQSTIFCYTSLDRRAASAAVDAVNARLAGDVEHDFVLSRPVRLDPAREDIVRAHTADRKRAVFYVRLTRRSALYEGRISALVQVLRRAFPDVLVLWDDQLRL